MDYTFNILSICIAAILAITTIAYALITNRMLIETRRLRESQTEPNIFITVEPNERARSFLNLVIQNIGQGPAFDLKFKVDPDILLGTGEPLSKVNFMIQGFSRLAPKQRFEFFIANAREVAKDKARTLYNLTVFYNDKNRKPYEASYVLDFTEYFGMPHIAKDQYEGVINKLDTIHRDLERVSRSTGSKLWVVAYTKQEYEDEIRKQLEEYEELERKQKEK